MAQREVNPILKTYLRRLTNLSSANRSLFLPRLLADQFIDVHEFSHLSNEKSFSIIEGLISQTDKTLCAVTDARMESVNEVSKKIKRLQRFDDLIFDERGAKDLHVGWPFVEGKFMDGTLVKCPLLFFPVLLKQRNGKWILSLREDAPVQFNKTFLLSYSYYNKQKADETLLDETFDELDQDSTVFRTQLYHILQKSNLEIHFNAENYRDELAPFHTVKKAEFAEGHEVGKLKLYPQAVLGIFPQAGSFLVPDYVELLERENVSDLESLFMRAPAPVNRDLNFLSSVKEDKILPVFAMDMWQENALKAVKLGHSLVVQGPPGTGKSQLICNLISDGMAQGKRILVVCQKRAALEVVYKRMQDEGLADFLAMVHDFKNDRGSIAEKIARQINRVDEYRARNGSLDTIQLERSFLHSSRRIDHLTEELESFRAALYDEQECGKSIKELYLNCSLRDAAINLKQELPHYSFSAADSFIQKLRTYSFYAQKVESLGYPWKERKSFASWVVQDLEQMKEILHAVPNEFRSIQKSIEDIIGVSLQLQDCLGLVEQTNHIEELITLIDRAEVYSFFQRMTTEADEEISSLWLSNIERVINDCYTGHGPEVTIASSQLGQFQKALSRSLKARRSLVGLARWELFSKEKFLLQRAFVSNGLTGNKAGFLALETKLDNRLNLEHNISKLKSKNWLLGLPEQYNLDEWQRWFGNQLIAIEGKLKFSSIRGLRDLIPAEANSQHQFVQKLRALLKLLHRFKLLYEHWTKYMTVSQIARLVQEKDSPNILIETLKYDFDGLCAYDKLREDLIDHERDIIQKLFESGQTWNFEKLKSIFINSLSLAWIEHIENKHPQLRQVSSGQLGLLEAELQEQVGIKQKLSTEIILLKARENVIADLEFNRLNNRVTYRDLLHQATKKKKVWPIRKIISEFEHEVYKLLPCWLASPESVSALFPLKETFDLVVFDEASQCFAERGIPAMYRGKQVLVAGDSKQLRPGDFYTARWNDEDEEHPDLEIDSLLDLAGRYWPSLQLKGHYRSHSPELIQFSNDHFYGGGLTMLPEFSRGIKQPVIKYQHVGGAWSNQCNAVEAKAVVDEIIAILRHDQYPSLGVITFNAAQQMLILDELDAACATLQVSVPSSIFVKNIENVQGDERDTIIFSIGYAPDNNGVLRAQFGSLNAAGGENRLNVAITRARKSIVIIASIWPTELNTAESKNEGPKLLKEYLQFALSISNQSNVNFNSLSQAKNNHWYLSNRIMQWAEQRWGDHLVEQANFPVYDLLVKEKEGPRGALLLDDELYARSLSAKAAHATTPILLSNKGWPFLRLHSRNYWLDQERFFNEASKLFVAID